MKAGAYRRDGSRGRGPRMVTTVTHGHATVTEFDSSQPAHVKDVVWREKDRRDRGDRHLLAAEKSERQLLHLVGQRFRDVEMEGDDGRA
jgi:hypothetical protein